MPGLEFGFNDTVMNCSGQDISSLPDPPANFVVKALDISYCSNLINFTSSIFTDFTDLQVVLMRGLTYINLDDATFQNLSDLRVIDFTGSTVLSTLPSNLFAELSNLAAILGLKAASLPDSIFSGLENLKSVSMEIEAANISASLFQVRLVQPAFNVRKSYGCCAWQSLAGNLFKLERYIGSCS